MIVRNRLLKAELYAESTSVRPDEACGIKNATEVQLIFFSRVQKKL